MNSRQIVRTFLMLYDFHQMKIKKLPHPGHASQYCSAVFVPFLMAFPSPKEKKPIHLKTLKMSFQKRSLTLFVYFTLSQGDFVAIVTECQSSSAIGEILKQQQHINYTCVNGIPSSHKCSSFKGATD